MKKIFSKRRYKIRSVLLLSFAFIILIMSANTLLLSIQYKNILSQLNESYQKMYLITDFSEILDDLMYDITGYYDVEKNDRTRIKSHYDINLSKLKEVLSEIKNNTEAPSQFIISDINNMVITIDEAVKLYFQTIDNESLSAVYIRPQLSYIERHKEYIDNEINRLSNSILQDSKTYNESFEKRRAALEVQVIVSTCAIILLCLITAIIASRYLTQPIKRLAVQMKKFNAADNERNKYQYAESNKYSLEVNSLIGSYKKMTDQIYALIDELTLKADIERQLHQQKIDNLEMKNLLRKTELHMLQMQINPHFLFNTLNSIHALSVMENGESTGQMISRLSKILRYSLRELDQMVTLSEEIDNVENYIELQKMRFGKRIEFNTSYDEQVLDTKVPGMIIQPLIENAIMHAFNKEGLTGSIWLSVSDEIDYVSISIRDNGLGMEEDTIQKILSEQKETGKNELSTDTHGIGLDNVIRRIRILYGKNAFRIKSAPNKGTTLILKISKSFEK